jgi:hypothetical protein
MGNNLDAYRAAIRLFHACKMSLNIGYDTRSDTFHDILITNLKWLYHLLPGYADVSPTQVQTHLLVY